MKWIILVPLVGLLLATIPLGSAGTPSASSTVRGTVVSCSSTIEDCSFSFSNAIGSGFATTTIFGSSQISFRLPGEVRNTTGVPISYALSKTNATTERVNGTFFGTDQSSGKVVNGATVTNFTITTHCGPHGCYSTYALRNGTIAVTPTKFFGTITTVGCTPSSTHPGHKTSCVVSVTSLNTATYPSGKVHLSSGRLGSFSNKGYCTLSAGNCSVTFTPYDNTCGTVTISANFPGNATFYHSSGSTILDVIVSGGC